MFRTRRLAIGLVLPLMVASSFAYAGPRDFPWPAKSVPAADEAYAQVLAQPRTTAQQPAKVIRPAGPRYIGGPKGVAVYSE